MNQKKKFDEGIEKLREGINITKKLINPSLKKELKDKLIIEVNKIKKFKIKKIVLELGMKCAIRHFRYRRNV